MESFLSLNLSSDALLCLNRCRLFLKVTTLSDITTGDGNGIQRDPPTMNGQPNLVLQRQIGISGGSHYS